MTSAQAPDREPTRLGHEVAGRLRLPGPPVGRPLPSRVGSLASSLERFASSLSRPVEIRRGLRGPGSYEDSVRPPRWWTGTSPAPDAGDDASAAPVRPGGAVPWLAGSRPLNPELPGRGLPRAARAVQHEESYTPGGILGGLKGQVVRVRRHDEVAAAGPMLTAADTARLGVATVRRRAESARRIAVSTPPPASPAAAPAPVPAAPGQSSARSSARPAGSSAPAGPDTAAGITRASGPASSGTPAPADAAVPAPSPVASTVPSPAAGPAAGPGTGAGADPGADPGAGTNPGAGRATSPVGSTGGGPSGVRSSGGGAPAIALRRASFQLRPLASRLSAARARRDGAELSAAPRRADAGAIAVGPAGRAEPGSAQIGSAQPGSAGRIASGHDRRPGARVWTEARRHRIAGITDPLPSGQETTLRRAVGSAEPVRTATASLLAAPAASTTHPARRESWAATSSVVRRRALDRALDLARSDLARSDLARSDLARSDLARPDPARSDPARSGQAGADASAAAGSVAPRSVPTVPQPRHAAGSQPDVGHRATGLPAGAGAAPAPAAPSARATGTTTGATADPAAHPAAGSTPGSTSGTTSRTAVALPTAPTVRRRVVPATEPGRPGALAHESGDWSRATLSSARSVTPALGLAMPDLLTWGRRAGRSAESPGALPSGFGSAEQIRAATGGLGVGALPVGPGPMRAAEPGTGASSAVRRRASATPRRGLGLLIPTLTRTPGQPASEAVAAASTRPGGGSAAARGLDSGAGATTSAPSPAGSPATALRRRVADPSRAARPTPASPVQSSPSPSVDSAAPLTPAGPASPGSALLGPALVGPAHLGPASARAADAAALRTFLDAGAPGALAGAPSSRDGAIPGAAPALRRRVQGAGGAPAPREERGAAVPRSATSVTAPGGGHAPWLEPLARQNVNRREGAMSSPVPEGRPRPPALPLPPASSSTPATVHRSWQGARPSGNRGSLLDRTAHLFSPESASDAAPQAPAPGGGAEMALPTTITRSAHAGGPAVPDSASMDPQQLDAVIAAVVERIEQRVVDELERRGRRTGRSGF